MKQTVQLSGLFGFAYIINMRFWIVLLVSNKSKVGTYQVIVVYAVRGARVCVQRECYMFVSKTDRLDQLQVAADSCYIYGIIVHQIVRLLLSEQSMCVEEVSACYAMGFNTSKLWRGGDWQSWDTKNIASNFVISNNGYL